MKDKRTNKKKIRKFRLNVKYAADFVVALLALIISSPVFLAIAIAIKIEDGGKIIFTQERRGKHGKIFNCYKFRSMKDTDIPFDPLHAVIKDNNSNVTKVGKFIRKFRLDELPQLLNIIRGDMCIIGHRPLLAHYFVYDEWELIKFEMRPGLTGLGQVMGNGHLSERVRRYYDAYYVTHVGFLTDIKIFFKTIGVLLVGERRFLKPVSTDDYEGLKKDVMQNYTISADTYINLSAEEIRREKSEAEKEAAADNDKKE